MVEFKKFINSYPNFKDCCIQLFDDNESRRDIKLQKKIHMKYVDRNKIKEYNDEGRGVFFSVNSMKEPDRIDDGQRGRYLKHFRDKESVTHINARVAESDTLSKEEQMKLIDSAPIRPSMVIESNKSYHIYYFAEDGDKESWLPIERGLAKYYQGDQSFGKNYSMVLRIPGTLHQKDPDHPFKIVCLRLDDTRYTKAQIMEAFPYDMELENKTEVVFQPLSLKESENIWDFMSSLGNEYMLSRVSGHSIVGGDKIEFKKNGTKGKQIYCNGKSTACRLDEKDYIGSSSGGPTRIQWCVWYGVSKPDILRWFFEFCSDLIPERFDRTAKQVALDKSVDENKREQKQIETKSAFQHITASEKLNRGFEELWMTDPNKVMKFGWDEWDSYLGGIYGGMIYLVGGDSGTGKSTFVNQVAANLSKTGVRVTRYSLEDRMEDSAKQEIYYTINRIRFKEKRNRIEWVPFVNGEYTHENGSMRDPEILIDITNAIQMLECSEVIDLDKTRDVKIDELVQLMNEECDKGTKCFFIDHLHYFKYETDKQREDLQIEAAMKGINEVARQRNVAVFLVAHYKSAGSDSKEGKSSMSSFKGSSSIKQIANIIIQIRRDGDDADPRTYFDITKLRGPLPKKELMSRFDLALFEYAFTITKEQKEAEQKHLESKLFKVD